LNKKDSLEIGIDYEHQKAKDYLTQQHRNSSNSSLTTKMIAIKHSCKFLHQLNPLTSLWKATKKIKQVKESSTPLRTSQGTWAKSNVEKAHVFAEYSAKVFKPHPSENEPEEKALTELLDRTNSN
jgi:hypothetical protein